MAAELHLHLFDYDIDADGDYQVPARVGIAAFNSMGSIHNHGDAVLTVASITFGNESNATAALIGGPAPGPTGTYDPDESRQFVLQITPTTYGAWSFDMVITSDDPDSPLTVTFEGMAYGTQTDIGWTAPNRRLEWTAQNRRLEWTAI